MSDKRHSASFRDPSGFLFEREGVLYRQVNQRYAKEYDHLIESGLYANLEKIGRLVSHQEVEVSPLQPETAYKVLQPEAIPFISYPYEWSFSQLKEAAMVTLSIQERALKVGMSLKDASAYNIQFLRGKAMLIDTLSFELYQDGQPWVAYKQFCQHFLAPLALMAKKDVRLSQLLRVYIDGIPLDLASELLPGSTRMNAGLMMHLHVHAKAQERYADKAPQQEKGMSKDTLVGLIENLKNTVQKLEWEPAGTEWGDYYEQTNYTEAAFQYKQQLISAWLGEIKPAQVWDLGANTGVFSRLAAKQGAFTVSFDIDPAAVEQNYQQMRADMEENLLPLLLDLTNPSPAIGWHHRERHSLTGRGPVEMVFALALVHHLAISNNVPLPQLAAFFADLGKYLVIEFVPKTDSQVQRLLQSRQDIFDQYTQEDFESAFEEHFRIVKWEQIAESERVLYLMGKR